jgi:hypothetical protein
MRKAPAKACLVNQSSPMRALAPKRSSMERTDVGERRMSNVTSSREWAEIRFNSFCCSGLVQGR